MNTSTPRIDLQQVLVANGYPQTSQVALSYAIGLAERYGSTVHVATIIGPECLGDTDLKTNIGTHMDEVENRLKLLPHRVALGCGKVSEELIRIIRKNEIDLVVVGTRGYQGINKFLSGSVAEEIYRRAPCPVLAVGPNVPEMLARPMELREIVYATDFSEQSLAALEYAISFAQETKANLTLVHVAKARGSISARESSAETLFNIERLRNLIPKDLVCHRQPECMVVFGSPAERLLEIASERMAGLIVLGVRRPAIDPNLSTHLPWSLAQKIVSKAHCPVLTISS